MTTQMKANPAVIRRQRKDNKDSEADYKFSKALFQLGANKLIEALQKGETILTARDLKDIYTIKKLASTEDLDEAGMYFVTCNSCLFFRACSLYKEGGECSYNLKASDIKSSRDIVNVMIKLLQIESDRIQRSLLIEKLEGSVDKEVSSEIMQYFDMVERLKAIMSKEETVEIKVKGQGVISKIFGSMLGKPEEGTKVPDFGKSDDRVPVEVELLPSSEDGKKEKGDDCG